MGKVAVVTDSTCDLPLDLADELDLRIVPMSVAFGDDTFISKVTIDTDAFYERMRTATRPPTTSQPSPAWFEEAYADAADDGADSVVSVHVSAELSGTCGVAEKVAAGAPLPVTVVDSRTTSGALALAVLAALRAAESGADRGAVAATAERVASSSSMFFVVDDLQYLRRGGRLTGTQKLIGTALKVKPILTIRDGQVTALTKVRTWSRAVEHLYELVIAAAGDRAVDLVVTDAVAEEQASELARRIEGSLDVRHRNSTDIGPVLGSHTGPGALGVAVAPADG